MNGSHNNGSVVSEWQPVGQVFIRTREEIRGGVFDITSHAAQFAALYQQSQWVLPEVDDVAALFDRCVYGVKQAIEASDAHLRRYVKVRESVRLPLYKAALVEDVSAEELFHRFYLDCTEKVPACLAPIHMVGVAHIGIAKDSHQSVSLSPATFIEYENAFYGIAVSIRNRILSYRLFQNTSELRTGADQVQVIGFTLP